MNPRTVPEHLRDRPVHGGLPVPWVALWTQERDLMPVIPIYRQGGVQGHQSPYLAWWRGMWWSRLPNTYSGTPLFAQVHGARQVRSMLGPRCQVCAARMTTEEAVWMIPGDTRPEHGTMDTWLGLGVTHTPPVCPLCAETTAIWCPHMSRVPFAMLTGAQVRPVPHSGHGQVWEWHAGLKQFIPEDAAVLLDEAEVGRFTIARNLVVKLEPR